MTNRTPEESSAVEPHIVITPSAFDIEDVRAARSHAYREGFEAGAKAMRDKCANLLDLSGEIEDAIRELPLPTPTTKGGA